MGIPGIAEQDGFRLLGPRDMEGRHAVKLAREHNGDRPYLHAGHFRHAVFCSDRNHGLSVLRQE